MISLWKEAFLCRGSDNMCCLSTSHAHVLCHPVYLKGTGLLLEIHCYSVKTNLCHSLVRGASSCCAKSSNSWEKRTTVFAPVDTRWLMARAAHVISLLSVFSSAIWCGAFSTSFRPWLGHVCSKMCGHTSDNGPLSRCGCVSASWEKLVLFTLETLKH